MKYFLLLSILILSISKSFAVNTNVYDNVLIRNNFQFTGGSPALNSVLTSDATGKYTPQTILTITPTALTNIANASGISWTGQGTHTMAPVLDFSIIVTNNGIYNIRSSTVSTTNLIYTVLATDQFVLLNTTNNSVRAILPTSGSTGRRLWFMKADESGFAGIIDAGSAKFINGSTNLNLSTKYQSVMIIDNGTEWFAK